MRLLKSKSANMSIGGIIVTVIGIVIAVTVIPIALTTIESSEGNYTPTQIVLLSLVGLTLVIGVLFAALTAAGIKIKM